MKKIIYKLFGQPISNKKGVKGTSSGRLYLDKKVFFIRPDVQDTIKRMKNSQNIKNQVELANN
jgi:hypothetical protein